MPPLDESGERTYMPTPLRLQEARREGRVARSGDVTAVAALLASLGALALLGRPLLEGMRQMVAACLDFSGAPLADGAASQAAGDLAAALGGVVLPAAGVCTAAALAAVLANVAQTRGLVAPVRVSPQWQRLSPAGGLRRLFGARSLVRGLLSVAKLAAIVAVTWKTFAGSWPRMLAAAGGDGETIAAVAGNLVWRLGLRLAAALLVLAFADYLYQWWQHRQDLKMTRRDWLDDMRRMEGDPRRSRRRRAATKSRRGDLSAAMGVAGATREQG
ncbi:MAG: EscU/YscU/HrcU family type III secretion system export apparatus switch protein [Phycisphaerae bacterium]